MLGISDEYTFQDQQTITVISSFYIFFQKCYLKNLKNLSETFARFIKFCPTFRKLVMLGGSNAPPTSPTCEYANRYSNNSYSISGEPFALLQKQIVVRYLLEATSVL